MLEKLIQEILDMKYPKEEIDKGLNYEEVRWRTDAAAYGFAVAEKKIIELIRGYIRNAGWIPCTEKMPENGETVEITYMREVYGKKGKVRYRTARAFYTDGTMTAEDSGFYDEDADWEYCAEEDVTYIPAGWWESVAFSETFSAVDNKVIAWRPISEPYNPQKSIGDDYKKQIMEKFLRVE